MLDRPIQRSGLPLLLLAAITLLAAVGIVILVGSPYIDALFGDRTGSEERADPNDPGEPPVQPSESPAPATETQTEAATPAETAPAATEAPAETATPATPDPPAETPEPAATQTPPQTATPAQPAGTHLVVKGDTLFDLSRRYWADAYLWPSLFVANQPAVRDPDFLTQGARLDIPTRPDLGANAGIGAVGDAHIEAYRRYRSLGDQTLARGREIGNPWLIQLGLIRINKAHWVLYSGLRYDANLLDKAEGAIPAADLTTVRGYVTHYGPQPGQ